MKDWLELYQKIMQELHTDYGEIQPGYLGNDYKNCCICFVGIRPGALKTWSEADKIRLEKEKNCTFEEKVNFYGEMLRTHPLISKFVYKILSTNKLSWENVMWINLVKSPSKDNSEPTEAELEEHMRYTLEQINLVNPDMIVSVGILANKMIDEHFKENHIRCKHYSYLARTGTLETRAAEVGEEMKCILEKKKQNKSLKDFIRGV